MDKIKKVEHGLRYQIVIAGEKNPLMSLADRMKFHKVPGVSIAVINEGKIEWAKGYGSVSLDADAQKVDTNTLFQAASISKPVTAMGALLLVEQGKLALDEDVNNYLKSWKVPDNKFTTKEKVTLRRLLSHTAGTSVHGFPGYAIGEPIPTTIEIVEGKKPLVHTEPVRVIQTPGKEVMYSGGGTTIVQLLIEEVTGEKFDVWMKKNVLIPFGMHTSTFAQPLTQEYAHHAAYGHNQDGTQVSGKWHIYPEMAAAGLWTTPTDLAQFLITILTIAQGKKTNFIGQKLMQEALKLQINTPESDCSGPCLGFFSKGTEKDLTLHHGGSNEGFIANIHAYPELDKGWVIMTNGRGGAALMPEIESSIAATYDIPGFQPIIKNVITLDPSLYNKFTGIYKDQADNSITISERDGQFFVVFYPPLSEEIPLYATENNIFFSKEIPEILLQFLSTNDIVDRIIVLDKKEKPMLDKDKKEILFKKSNTESYRQ